MSLEEKRIIQRVIENFVRTGAVGDEQVEVTCLPENKSSAIEYVNGESRSVMLDEYKADGVSVWAGFGERKEMLYISPVKSR